MPLCVETFVCRTDNYGFLAHDPATGATAAIDAPEAGPIIKKLRQKGWTLTDIFITHHHADHTEAIPALKTAYDLRVTGPAAEAQKIGPLDIPVSGGSTAQLGSVTLKVLATPGHTLGHVSYYDAQGGHLFCGDALFSLGCGRMFEGTPGPMWSALAALRGLPDETLVYCGHEYTQANARFALSVDPHNRALIARAGEVTRLRAAGHPTIPSRLGIEKQANPFLRAGSPVLAAAMNLKDAAPATVFAALRAAKDRF